MLLYIKFSTFKISVSIYMYKYVYVNELFATITKLFGVHDKMVQEKNGIGKSTHIGTNITIKNQVCKKKEIHFVNFHLVLFLSTFNLFDL